MESHWFTPMALTHTVVTTLSMALSARHTVALYSELMCADSRLNRVSPSSGGAGGIGLGGGDGDGGCSGSGGHKGMLGRFGGVGAPAKIEISAMLTYRAAIIGAAFGNFSVTQSPAVEPLQLTANGPGEEGTM